MRRGYAGGNFIVEGFHIFKRFSKLFDMLSVCSASSKIYIYVVSKIKGESSSTPYASSDLDVNELNILAPLNNKQSAALSSIYALCTMVPLHVARDIWSMCLATKAKTP